MNAQNINTIEDLYNILVEGEIVDWEDCFDQAGTLLEELEAENTAIEDIDEDEYTEEHGETAYNAMNETFNDVVGHVTAEDVANYVGDRR